jgi:hypothetical protein
VKVNSWSIHILFLSCWYFRVVKPKTLLFLKIIEIYKRLVAIGKESVFTWIPIHIGIHGNTVVDQDAKNALDDPISISSCCIQNAEFKPFIVKYILKLRQDSCDHHMNNKLHEIHSLVRKTHCSYDKNHKGHVVLTRCSIGHGRLMRNYLLNNEQRHECIPCYCN